MLRVVFALSGLLLLAAAGLLTGCGPIDVYAFRAIQYNFEAEETQNQVILLNIVRSSLHRPMEFTEITNIVGANSATGTVGLSLPIGPHPAASITTATPSASLSGTTTFTIPVLDTQDFYQGLLNDIQPQLLGYYLQTPFIPKDLILNLFIERIVLHDAACPVSVHSTICERDFRNNPDSREDIALFQTLVSYLERLNISVEQLKTDTKQQTQKPTPMPAVKSGSTTININNSSSASGSDTGSTSASGSSGAASKAPKYRLCFSPRGPLPPGRVPALLPTAMCGYQPKPKPADKSKDEPSKEDNAVSTDNELAQTTKVPNIGFQPNLAEAMRDVIGQLGDENHYTQSVNAFSGHSVSITFLFRSTGSIFNFLGQLVSATRKGPPIALYQPLFKRELIPCWLPPPGPLACKPIISVNADGAPTLVSVGYAGSLYAVPGDPDLSYSPDVFTILKQLVALNLSGKNLPTTAILTVSP